MVVRLAGEGRGHIITALFSISRRDNTKHKQECKQTNRPQGYKTFFMLNSVKHGIFHANKSQIINNAKFFLAKHN